jgi:AcrR family transcriptional regulator
MSSIFFILDLRMAHQTIDDTSLTESLFEVFRDHGYEGTSISQLSEVTGLKKSSLYHRFPAGKDDMVKAVVLYVSEQLQSKVIEPLRDNKQSPQKRFSNMVSALKEFYVSGKKNCILNVLTIGEQKPEINALLNEGYNGWLAALTKLAKEAGINPPEAETRSKRFLIIVEGALVIQRLTNNAATFQQSIEHEQLEFFKQSDS